MADSVSEREKLLNKGWNADEAAPCEECGGDGEVITFPDPPFEVPRNLVYPHRHEECQSCLGTGVQP